jgi:hypothetical protein
MMACAGCRQERAMRGASRADDPKCFASPDRQATYSWYVRINCRSAVALPGYPQVLGACGHRQLKILSMTGRPEIAAMKLGRRQAAGRERRLKAASVSSRQRQELDVQTDVPADQGRLTAVLVGIR